MQSRARASEPTSIEDVLQEDLVMYHTSPKERVYCITIPFVLKASSHVELVQAAPPPGRRAWPGPVAPPSGEHHSIPKQV